MKDRFSFLIDTFIENTSRQLKDMQTAIDNNNAEEIIAISHGLKGSSGSVGATSMHLLSKSYEDKARAGELDNISGWVELLTIEFERYKTDIQVHL